MSSKESVGGPAVLVESDAAAAPAAPRSSGEGRLRLTDGGSMLLDVVRFGAAFVVLVDHWVDPTFTRGWPGIGEAGHAAVCVFFVLSGFMIRFVTRSRVDTAPEYLIDRASRLYSVVLPALAFTMATELIVGAVNPAAWQAFRAQLPWVAMPLAVLQNIFFTQQCWGYGLPALSDAPFWSLSFEVFYYIGYGLLHYRVRWRWLALALLLALGGPAILLLAPIWWMGCWTCDLYLCWRQRLDGGMKASGGFLAGLLALLVLSRHPLVAFLHHNRIGDRQALLERVTAGWRGPDLHIFGQIPWLDSASPSYLIVGLLTAAVMLFGLLAVDRWRPSASRKTVKRVRYVAEGTFGLYLLHVPMMELIVGLLKHPIASRAGAILMLLAVLLVCVLAADPMNRLKDWMRRTMRREPARSRPA